MTLFLRTGLTFALSYPADQPLRKLLGFVAELHTLGIHDPLQALKLLIR